jgi:hypothetical protein
MLGLVLLSLSLSLHNKGKLFLFFSFNTIIYEESLVSSLFCMCVCFFVSFDSCFNNNHNKMKKKSRRKNDQILHLGNVKKRNFLWLNVLFRLLRTLSFFFFRVVDAMEREREE